MQDAALRSAADAGPFRPADDTIYPSIEDYAAIGDGRSVALVSREGSIDWLCLPHFSAPPFFAALLDRRRGGRFALRPVAPFRARRRYIGDTNVVETSFETKTGRCLVTDCMTLLPASRYRDELRPQAEILRQVRGDAGEVELEIICEPKPDFGRAKGNFEARGKLGWAFCCADQVLFLQGEMPLLRSDNETIGGTFRISAGETRCVSLAYTRRDIAVVPELGSDAIKRLEETCTWWRNWSDSCTIRGKYRNPIVRSVLVLKLLSYSLSGAVVAAATTSLPEAVGGTRNWDYRYCWLRDAALIVQAFVHLGYTQEAESFIDWLLHATRLTWPRLDVLYDVFGEVRLPERELVHLEGYKKSRPVRIGNGAHDQLQLDVYGAVIQAAYEYVEHGGKLEVGAARCLAGFGRQVCKLWREADNGIWEKRTGRAHHTYSKMMCWVALDRLLKLARMGNVRIPVERFERERDAIEDTVERRGFNADLNSYVAELDGDMPDASLILAARCGYRSADHPRMLGTYDFIERLLGVDGMLYRYVPETDGIAGKEGTFGIAGFWAVEYLARAGRTSEAGRRFERLLERSNDLGLYAEEMDPETGAALGNFPQAFTHVGLIAAAMALRCAEAGTSSPGSQ